MKIDIMNIDIDTIMIKGANKVKSTLLNQENTVIEITMAAVEKAATITTSGSETAAMAATK